MCRPALPSHSAFSRAWHGEIGLYRAAYGLGGLGLALVSLLGDALLSISPFAGGIVGCLSYMAGGAGELAFAWVSIVATWRAAQRGRPDGRATGQWLSVWRSPSLAVSFSSLPHGRDGTALPNSGSPPSLTTFCSTR